MFKREKQSVLDLKQKTCGEFKYKTFLVNRADAIGILNYIEYLEDQLKEIEHESMAKKS